MLKIILLLTLTIGAQVDTVEIQLRKIVAEKLGVSENIVTRQARFIEDLGADSLDFVELIITLEEEYDFEIPDEDADKIRTFGGLVAYIKRRLKE
jgi:acyl carrier protein